MFLLHNTKIIKVFKKTIINNSILFGIQPPEEFISIPDNTIIDVNIYPNPTTATSTITFSLLESGNITLEIVDLLGNVFYTVSDYFEIGENFLTIDTKGIPIGSYICRFIMNDKTIGTVSFVARFFISMIVRKFYYCKLYSVINLLVGSNISIFASFCEIT